MNIHNLRNNYFEQIAERNRLNSQVHRIASPFRNGKIFFCLHVYKE